jgi:hypothetical protein
LLSVARKEAGFLTRARQAMLHKIDRCATFPSSLALTPFTIVALCGVTRIAENQRAH